MPNIHSISNGRDTLIRESRTGPLGVGLDYRTRLNLYPHLSNFTIWASGTFTTTRRTLGIPLGSAVNLGTFPATPRILSFASTSATDTSAGTGARTITIVGLDANKEAQQESGIILTGQTPVNSTKTYSRINRIFIDDTGSGGVNEGDIYASDTTDTFIGGIPQNRVYCAVIVGENNDTWGNFSLGKHTTLYLVKGNHFNNATANIPILIEERYLSPNFTGGITDYTSGALWYTGNVSYNFDGAGPVFGPSDISWTGTASTGVREGAIYYESSTVNNLLDFDNTFSFTQNRNIFG